MSAQPADVAPVRDAGPVRLLHAVPDQPREAPRRPVLSPQAVTSTPLRPVDRVAVTLLAMFAGGPLVAYIGQWWALGALALVWVALVVWTARGEWA